MPDFRRGAAAITAAQESNKGGGNFKPFAPSIVWSKDREEKYIGFITPADDIPTVELHEWIVVGQTKGGKPIYESFLSRKDPAIGETYDDIEDRLGGKARLRTIGVAVELEPTFETVKGRQRPTGFQVKTDTYTRKTDDGDVEVTYPKVGLIVQSPFNFFGWVGSFNDAQAPIEETPVHVLRRGKDANTAYDFTPYLDQPIDYTNLFDYIDGVSYLSDVELQLDGLEPAEAAQQIGNALLEKRLEELADGERYEELVSGVEELNNPWGANPTPNKDAQRPARPSQRSARPAVAEKENVTTAAEAPAPRKSKFAKLRAEVEG